MTTALLLVLLLLIGTGAEAQEVVFDTVSGNYNVTVVIDGELVEKTLVPADKVDVAVVVGVFRADDGWTYSYQVIESPTSTQDLGSLSVPCPLEGGLVRDRSAIPIPDPTAAGPWFGMHGDFGAGEVCKFLGGAVPLSPGGTLAISVEAELLPAIGVIQAVGAGAGITVPYDDVGFEGSVEVFQLQASLNGTDGGWREIESIVPLRPPALFGDGAEGLALLIADLDSSCGALGWISATGLCSTLRVALAEASASIAAGDNNSARDALQGFLGSLLDDSRLVSAEAHTLFQTNVEYLLTQIRVASHPSDSLSPPKEGERPGTGGGFGWLAVGALLLVAGVAWRLRHRSRV